MGAATSGGYGYEDFIEIYAFYDEARREYRERGPAARADIYAKYAVKIALLCEELGIDPQPYLRTLDAELIFPLR